MRKPPRRKNCTVRLEVELWEDLKIKADQLSMTRSEILFLLIIGFLQGKIELPEFALGYGSQDVSNKDISDPYDVPPSEGMLPPA